MHPIKKKMWERGLNFKEWCALHKFNWRYADKVVRGLAGKWDVGNAKLIKDALKNEGYI